MSQLHSFFYPSIMKFSITFLLVFFCSCLIGFSYGSQTNSMQNRHLKVSAEPWRPFFLFYCDGKSLDWTQRCHEGGKVTYGGSLWELLKFMQRARNVTFSISRTSGGNWGHCHEKDNCTGMIGVVNRKEADLAIGISLKCKRLFLLLNKSFLRPFQTNYKQVNISRFYRRSYSTRCFFYHHCSSEVPEKVDVIHGSFDIRYLDLFPG